MRFFPFVLALALSLSWVLLLNRPLGKIPAMGRLLNPVNGFWNNAEPASEKGLALHLPADQLKQEVSITFDDRLVPHIKAKNEEDLYFAQGYIHATYRLWQMDMQTRAAAGRLSEILGEQTFEFDRTQRRKGMLWAAENSLKAMEAEPVTSKILNAYTRGVNAYIENIKLKDYPLEYKLMGFQPEPWTNLKSALLMKYMADDLTGKTDDIALTYLRDTLGAEELNRLFPEKIEGSRPVIPAGTTFPKASLATPAIPQGNVFASFKNKTGNTALTTGNNRETASDAGIGSNNWAIAPERSRNDATLLCNDPHLSLNLPSIWYEQQLSAPGINCYGVTIPGAPGIVIGFNDSISWGLTNNYRDVKDYYEIRTEDSRFYFFDGKEVPFNERREHILVKGRDAVFIDTIRYTIHGPLMYDEHFPEPSGSGKKLAMTWMAHQGTNELYSLYLLNRAENYNRFVTAISFFECPAQNFIYTDRRGNIALWGQGRFINKWKDQGRFVMRGDISATLWGEKIPMSENPHVLNPAQKYLASANQNVTDNTYPYWYNGDFSEFRSWAINHFLQDTTKVTLEDMMDLQNNTWSLLARNIGLYLTDSLSSDPDYASLWTDELVAGSKEATFFQIFWHFLYLNIWGDEWKYLPVKLYPSAEKTMLLLKDTTSIYFDDKNTPQIEGRRAIAERSYLQTLDSLKTLEKTGTEWYKVKNTTVTHLARIKAFSFGQLKTGGWGNTINAMKQNHGPSWRMIVMMSPQNIEAYGVYPGGQSGNPGSRFYADFLDYWATGKYYTIRFKEKD